MTQKFSTIPIRENDTDVDAGWWNILQLAGATIESFLGGLDIINETAFTIVNGQAAPANVTGLLFSSTTVGSAKVDYWIKRVTTDGGATELTEHGTLMVSYNVGALSWNIVPGPAGPNDSGVVFSITSGGQIQYTSSSITGTASVSKMKFKATTMGV